MVESRQENDGKLIRNQEYMDTLQFMNAWQASDS